MMNCTLPPKFDAGRMLATPAALGAIRASGQLPADFLDCHLQADWGLVGGEDWRLNDIALMDGSRLLSAYTTLRGDRLWIITEAADDRGRRVATTILLPDEYYIPERPLAGRHRPGG
jgi:hypothetical protein